MMVTMMVMMMMTATWLVTEPVLKELHRIRRSVADIWKDEAVWAHEHQRDQEKDSLLYLSYRSVQRYSRGNEQPLPTHSCVSATS